MNILSAKDEYKIPKSAYKTFFQNLPANADANAYAATFAEIFEMGQELAGRNLAKMVAAEGVELTEFQKELIYAAGTESRKSANETLNDAIKTARKAAEKNGKFNAKKGKVDTSKIKNMRLSKEQQSAVRLASVFSEFGINVVIDATTVAERKSGKENGSFNSRTGTLTLDINAGTNEEALGSGVFWTIAHEVTHLIKATSPESFDLIQEFVIEEKFKTVEEFDRAIAEEQAWHDSKHPNEKKMTRDQAIEEIVARSCESVFRDSKVLARLLADGEAKEQGFAEKVVNAIKEILEKIVTFFKSLSEEYNPESIEGKFFSENAERTQKLAKIFDQALETALENSKVVYGTENAFEDIGVDFDKNSESASPMFSRRTWNASEYVTNRDETARNLAEALDVPVEKAKQYIDNVNSIAKAISNDRARLDYQASSFGSAFVSNVEYGGSFDFTTLCKKRRIYTGTFSEIQRRIGEAVLTPEDILEIRNLMLKGGFEATCGLCYVEGSRANMGKFAKKFIELYKRDNPDAWIPKMVDVNTPDGVEQMRINHPEAYEKYEYFWNHYGKLNDSDPALFASQQKPKLYEARKEYKGEILQHFDDVEAIAKKNLKGGIRMQSFSDFEIVHLIDTMQIIMDMAKVGLAGQAYTKVPEFADAFGNTGLKINLSLIAKGVDENGKLIFDDREGMPAETAFKLRNKYSSNVGTIIVAFTDDQVKAAMADPRIDFIIPFHRSQWKKSQYGAMGLPKGTKDYTYMQNEKLIKPTYHEYRGRMVKDKATNFMPNEYWDFSKSGKENAENYLKMCAENNKRPKFYKFLDYDGKGKYSLKEDGSTDGYWKLLIDFKMYDNNGVGAPQTAVTPEFSMTEAMTMLDEYKGGHQKYPIAHGVVDKFVDTYESRHKSAVMYSDRSSIVDLSDDNELSKIVENVHGSKRYKIIAEYIFSVLGNQEIVLSDGRIAIVDKRDASHIASNAGSDKTRQIAKIKDLVTQAKLFAYEDEIEHNKFSEFLYYQTVAKYDDELFSLYINVGKALNDKKYHIYDITKKLRDTANRINGFERPKSNEGYALENDISNDIIPQTPEKVNTSEEKIMHSDRRPSREREILANVLADSSLKQRYYSKKVFLQKYQDAQISYNNALAEISRIENLIGRRPRGTTPNSETKRLQESLNFYYNRLHAAEEKMFTYEAEGLRDVIDSELERLTREGEAAARQARREAIRERVERASRAAEAHGAARIR